MTDIQGRCPACGSTSLFLGDGGHVTCPRIDCPDPSAVDQLLHGEGAAEAELARLRAGEEAGYDPISVPTPGQWIARWNSAAPEERLEVAQQIIQSSARAARCFEMAHEKQLRIAEATVARVRAESARIRSVTRTWEPVADLIDAALAGETPQEPAPELRLLDCGLCYEERGEEVHPHPECPIRAASRAGASVLLEQIREAVEPLLSEYPELGKIGTAALNALRVIERYEEAEGPVVGTARIGLNVHTGFTGGISSEGLRDGVILPAVSFEDARVLPLRGSPGWGRLVLADNEQSQFTIGQQQYAVSSEHPIVIEPFGPGTAGGLVTLTLVANTVTVNGVEVGDRE